MTTTAPSLPLDVRPDLGPEEFRREYADRRPVLIKGRLADLPAARTWSLDHFADVAPDLPVRLKTGRVADGATTTVPLAEYRDTVGDWEQRAARADAAGEDPGPPPAYLHDVPMLALVPSLQADLEPFPGAYLPPFFRREWWTFPQFFVGPSRAETPLHFDTLLTSNLFFQLRGSKRFVMVDDAYRDRCSTYNWRWSRVDPDDPDLDAHPRFRGVPLRTCIVEGGDLLYMPPGTLHKVTSLTPSVSFNIDWHTRRSSLRGLTAVRDGMPVANLRYNALFALGVWAGVPVRALMPGLRSYFTYIS